MIYSNNTDRDTFINSIKVSRETLAKLDKYAELLTEWNERINLVSKSSMALLWTRHILDSAQLFDKIPEETKKIVDLGSGAGFPGLVLSIMGVKNMHLIESIGKKANFLESVITEIGLDAKVHRERIELLENLNADVITARALGPLKELIRLAKFHAHKDSIYLFHKGKSAQEELTEAQKCWKFEYESLTSLSDSAGSILAIKMFSKQSSRS